MQTIPDKVSKELNEWFYDGCHRGIFCLNKYKGSTHSITALVNVLVSIVLIPWFLFHRIAFHNHNAYPFKTKNKIGWIIGCVLAITVDSGFIVGAYLLLMLCQHADGGEAGIYTLFGAICFIGLMYIALHRIPNLYKKIPAPIEIPDPENAVSDWSDKAFEYEEDEEDRIDVDSMSGPDFERFCADLLRIHGYTDIYLTPASGDHGIDITAEKDSLKWGFQCKRWSDTKVDNTTVAQTYTGKALYECDIVAIITTSGFTRQAESEAKQLGVKLWGRNRVKELMQKLEDRERYYFSRVA